jgi:pimeloyl-ACP methyl ester carboxylesterase
MMCDARLFTPQIAAFSGQRTILCAPLSGHASVQELASEILANTPPKFALAGLSMGGIVAMEILRQAPERVDRIALLDTNALAEKDDIKAIRRKQMIKVDQGGLETVMRDEMKPNYIPDGPNRGAILDLCMAMAMDMGPPVFQSQSQALMDRPDQTETLRRASLRALVLCGREDALCPVSRHQMMAELISDAQLEIIEGAGHLPTLEQPEMTNVALARWMEE